MASPVALSSTKARLSIASGKSHWATATLAQTAHALEAALANKAEHETVEVARARTMSLAIATPSSPQGLNTLTKFPQVTTTKHSEAASEGTSAPTTAATTAAALAAATAVAMAGIGEDRGFPFAA